MFRYMFKAEFVALVSLKKVPSGRRTTTYRQTDRKIRVDRQKDTQTDRTDRTDRSDRQTDRQTDRQKDKKIERYTDRKTERQTNRQTDRPLICLPTIFFFTA